MTSGLTSVSPNTFDFYVLALEWQPAWARDACPSGRRPNAGLVEKLSGDATGSYARTSLSLHGLWPDYDRGSMHAADLTWPCSRRRTSVDLPGDATATDRGLFLSHQDPPAWIDNREWLGVPPMPWKLG